MCLPPCQAAANGEDWREGAQGLMGIDAGAFLSLICLLKRCCCHIHIFVHSVRRIATVDTIEWAAGPPSSR